MKLMTFRKKNLSPLPSEGDGGLPWKTGLWLESEKILDLNAWLLSLEPGRGETAPATLAWLDKAGPFWGFAEKAWKQRGDAQSLESWEKAGTIFTLADSEIGPPVPRPGKIICVGLNYRDHAAETGKAVPERPLIFSKFTTAVLAPDRSVLLPAGSEEVDYEGELAVVMGRRCKGVKRDDALSLVAGYMNFNDVTARDFQYGDGQFQRGKSCDTFAPMGPYIATLDELVDALALDIRVRVNGEIRQQGNTRDMIFTVPDIIAFISETITLEPGDVIATGTPRGVGYGMSPRVFLKDGDLIEVEIEGLEILANRVKG